MSSKASEQLAFATKPGEGLMHALTWQGKHDVRISLMRRPTITDPNDIVVRTTGTTVCGSDLHLCHGDIPDIQKGEVLGHEGVGVVDQVGGQVTKFKVGDRVLVSSSITCGTGQDCKNSNASLCDRNEKKERLDELQGRKGGGILGYSHLLGGYVGTQSEYFRVPFGDFNCFHLPDVVSDEKAVLLADVSLTAYHSVVDIGFKEGETAAIWGAGPIGQLIAQWLTKVFGAKKVILIDNVAPRLQWAKDRLDVEVINFDNTRQVAAEVMNRVSSGVDVSFDAAGSRYSKSFLHRAMQTLALEADTPETLNEAIRATRTGGRISVVADYAGTCGGFLIGTLMEKAITLKGNGQAPIQRYMDKVLSEYIVPGKFDPTLILTHRFVLDDLAKLYRAFDKKRVDEATGVPYLKAFIETNQSQPRAQGTPELGPVPGG